MTTEQLAQVQRMINSLEETGTGEIVLKIKKHEWYLFKKTTDELPVESPTEPELVIHSLIVREVLTK